MTTPSDPENTTTSTEAAPPEQAAPVETPTDPVAEAEKYRDLALRARAELDNFRKRAVREKEEAVRYANAGLLDRILPVVDNFELGLEAARSATEAAAVVSGLDMVKRQLDEFLRESGVETIDAAGATFDHNLHDAMGYEPSVDVPEGMVIRQLRRGYKLRDRLLRPASVFVSSGSPES